MTAYFVDLATDNKPNDGGQQDPNNARKGDLRYCLTKAITGDTITFDPKTFNDLTTITLSAALQIKNKNLILDGPTLGGHNLVTISGNNTCRIFTITGTSKVSIYDLNLSAGAAP